MKKKLSFVEVIFKCHNCKDLQQVSPLRKVENKHNYSCACGQKFFVDLVKSKVMAIGGRYNGNV